MPPRRYCRMKLAMQLSVLMLVASVGAAAAVEPQPKSTELVTAPDAVLCLDAASLDHAHVGRTAGSQTRLQSLGCLRSPPGVPATLLSDTDAASSIWSVRFRPQGMSGGITLWGRPSAFTLPDGTPLRSQRADR
jgi:hypothetical protein